MDRNRVVTITELNLWTALTQADGFRCSENPLFQQGLSLRVLVCLLLPWPFLATVCLLVVVVFGWKIGLQEFVHRRRHSDHRPLHLILDCCTGSSFADG